MSNGPDTLVSRNAAMEIITDLVKEKYELMNKLNEKRKAWISVQDQLPEDNVTVLAVKQLKNGRREMCLAYCIRNYERFNPETFRNEPSGPYWVCGGNNNILYWMPLPEMPEEGLQE